MFLSPSVGLNGKSPWVPLGELSAKLIMASDVDSHRKIGEIVLADSANAFSAVHEGNPRCQDRLTRLHLRYVRGSMDSYILSFISEGFNLSDCGAKHRGNLNILYRVNSSSDCQIGFISRAAMKSSISLGRVGELKRKTAAGAGKENPLKPVVARTLKFDGKIPAVKKQ